MPEGAGDNAHFLGEIIRFHGNAGDAPQFQNGAQTNDAELFANPGIVGLLEVIGGVDSGLVESVSNASAHAPHFADFDGFEDGLMIVYGVQVKYAVGVGLTFGDVGGQLGEGLGFGDANYASIPGIVGLSTDEAFDVLVFFLPSAFSLLPFLPPSAFPPNTSSSWRF